MQAKLSFQTPECELNGYYHDVFLSPPPTLILDDHGHQKNFDCPLTCIMSQPSVGVFPDVISVELGGKGGGSKHSTLKKEVLLPGPGPYRVPVRELAPISVLPPNHTESLVDLWHTARVHAETASFPDSLRLGTRLCERDGSEQY